MSVTLIIKHLPRLFATYWLLCFLRFRSALCVLCLMKLRQHRRSSNAICYLLAALFSSISVSVQRFVLHEIAPAQPY